MTKIVMEHAASAPVAVHGMHAAGEATLRLVGAALQVLATLVVVRTLEPSVVGIYFEGFVIAYALAALLRGKYEMLILRVLLGECDKQTCIPMFDLLAALGRRVGVRCVLVCAVLLVITADLDIMEPRLRPFLETFFPFVLAVPFLAIALLLSGALRAARRSLGSTIIGAYSVNLAIIVAGALAPPESAFVWLSWAFVLGAVAASATGIVLVRKVFPAKAAPGATKPCVADWRQIYRTATLDYGVAGIALTGLQWGPLCVLAIAGPALQIAEIAVASRLALIVDLLMPSLVFVPLHLNLAPRLSQALHTERGRLLADLAFSALAASAIVVGLMLSLPPLLAQFGSPYAELTGLLAIVLGSQWINAAARPALRFMTTYHYRPVIFALCLSAATALVIAFFGVGRFGATAVAVAGLCGTLLLNASSLAAALREARRTR